MNLDNYLQKRDFRKSPEPSADEPADSCPPTFVIHRHEARRLHYDLRLAIGGVLKSWAVPKGFSFNPRDRRLAIRTEDHPLEYESFDGVIPDGQYGAGTMTIWDAGRFELVNQKEAEQSLDDGKLELRLFGGRLRGEWHLFQLKEPSDRNQWMIVKSRDRYAIGADDAPFPLELSRTKRTPFPKRRYSFMVAGKAREPFFDADWLYEIDLQGERVLVESDGQSNRIRGRSRDMTGRLPHIDRQLQKTRATRFILDAVLVALDDQGRPCREELERRLEDKALDDIQLYVFDLLYYDEWDLRPFTLLERKAALSSVLSGGSHVVFVDHERSRGQDLYATAETAGLPGLIAKRAASRYSRGASDDWINLPITQATDGSDKSLGEAIEEIAATSAASTRVSFTNLDKVLWPTDGFTKRDLISYYDQIADTLIPHLRDRPLSLNRFPNGITGDSFYQKDAAKHFPDWIETIDVASSSSRKDRLRYVVCNDRDTLLYLANLASIELHPWLSRQGSLDEADWAVLDFDPGDVPFPEVTKVARAAGKLLRGVGLRPYLKTSGAKGLHIYVPLASGYSYDHARTFCEGVANMLVQQFPTLTTLDRAKGSRGKKIYLDFMQNRRGQTVVAPYVVRPVPGASVSAPLDWDELETELHPSQFTIHNMMQRVDRHGDLFAAVLTDDQDLMSAIEAIIERLNG